MRHNQNKDIIIKNEIINHRIKYADKQQDQDWDQKNYQKTQLMQKKYQNSENKQHDFLKSKQGQKLKFDEKKNEVLLS